MNSLLGLLKKPSAPTGGTAPEPAALTPDELKYLQAYYGWLKQPLSPALAVRDTKSFSTTAHWLLSAATRSGCPQKEVTHLAFRLIRQVIFTHYYSIYEKPEWRLSMAQLSAAEAERQMIAIDQDALTFASKWAQEFSPYGISTNPTAPDDTRIDSDQVCAIVWREMCDRELIPKLTMPSPQPAPTQTRSQAAPTEQYIQQQLLQPSPVPAESPPPTPAPPVTPQPKPSGEAIMRQTQIKPEAIPELEFTEADPLHRYGLLLAKLISEKVGKGGVTYLPDASGGSNLYYGQLVFQMDPKLDFADLSDRVMQHAISWADLEPDTTHYQLRLLKGGRISLDLTIYKGANLDDSSLMAFLSQECNGRSLLNDGSPEARKKFLDLLATHLRALLILPGGHLQLFAGIHATGDPVLLPLCDRAQSGIVIAGGNGCGKSGLMLSFLAQLCFAFPPSELQVALLDFKGQAQTFQLAQAIPHRWLPPTESEWMQQVTTHQLKLPPDQHESLWSVKDVPLTQVPWLGADAIALLNALTREQARRSAIFQHYGVRTIFEYNDLVRNAKKPLPPMPFLPILIETGANFAHVVGNATVQKWLTTITSQWRDYGMPLIQTVPDHLATTLMPSNTPVDVATKILFSASEATVERALGKKDRTKTAAIAVDRLRKQADAIAFSADGQDHIHTFFLPTPHLTWLVKALTHYYKDWVNARSQARILPAASSLVDPVLPAIPDHFDAEDQVTPTESIRDISTDLDTERFQKLLHYFEKNEQAIATTGKRAVSTNEVLREVVGAYLYTDKDKVTNGDNRENGIKRLIELAAKQGLVLVEDEIRDMVRQKTRLKVV